MSEHHESLDKWELENSVLLRGVELDDVMGLFKKCSVRELKRGEVLIHTRRPNHFLYLLLTGRPVY